MREKIHLKESGPVELQANCYNNRNERFFLTYRLTYRLPPTRPLTHSGDLRRENIYHNSFLRICKRNLLAGVRYE